MTLDTPARRSKTVVGALVRMRGRLQMESPEVIEVTADRGQDVDLFVRYELEESSLQRETFTLSVDSAIEGHAPTHDERHHTDHPLLHDVYYGVVGPRFSFDRPGSYEGVLRAELTYRANHWLDGVLTEERRQAVEIPLRIRIR